MMYKEAPELLFDNNMAEDVIIVRSSLMKTND